MSSKRCYPSLAIVAQAISTLIWFHCFSFLLFVIGVGLIVVVVFVDRLVDGSSVLLVVGVNKYSSNQ